MKEIIMGSILMVIAIGTFVLCIRSFKEKGFLFNNTYIYASKQKRESMNKKPYYRQTAILFLLLGVIFSLNGLGVFFNINWINYIAIMIAVITIGYAIVSSIVIEKKNSESI